LASKRTDRRVQRELQPRGMRLHKMVEITII
jgi:hypothetical protein